MRIYTVYSVLKIIIINEIHIVDKKRGAGKENASLTTLKANL